MLFRSQKFGVDKEAIYERIAPVKESSDKLWEFVEHMIEDAYNRGLIKNK